MIEDGTLTLAEYERAKLAEVGCIKENGLEPDGPVELDGLLLYRYSVRIPASLASTGPTLIGQCSREYTHVIDKVWAEVSQPLIQKVIRDSRRAMGQCFRESGLKPEDEPHLSPDPGVRERYVACRDRVNEAFRLNGVSYGVEGHMRPE